MSDYLLLTSGVRIAFPVPFTLTDVSGLVSFHMIPAKQSDLESDFVPKFNFGIHLAWVVEISLITLSVLAYYYRVFRDMINNKKAKAMIWVPVIFVFVWALSSVSTPHRHNSTRSYTPTI